VPLILAAPELELPLPELELPVADELVGKFVKLDPTLDTLLMKGLAKSLVKTLRVRRDSPSCRQSTRETRTLYPPLEHVFWRQAAPPEHISKKPAMTTSSWLAATVTATT
jgi:hypothetical protein